MEGKIILADIPQADGETKRRPVVVLRVLPPYGDLLVSGVSTRLYQAVEGYDEVLTPEPENGLRRPSLIRLFYLSLLTTQDVRGTIGRIPDALRRELIRRLTGYLNREG